MPRRHAYTLEPGRPTPGSHNLLRSPFASCGGTGILTSFPSTTPFGLALGTDSPCADERCAGNLGLTARELFTPFIATHVSIRTSDISREPYDSPSQTYGTLSYCACVPFNSLAKGCRHWPNLFGKWRQTFINGEGACALLFPGCSQESPENRGSESVSTFNELRWIARTRSFGVQFEPRYIFRAGRLDQ